MHTRNICKFPITQSGEHTITIRRFIREASEEVLSTPQNHARTRMSLFLSGDGTLTVGGTRIPLASGTLVFLFSGERSVVECVGEVACMYIDFEGTRADELLRRFGIGVDRRVFEGFDGLIPIWQESLARASSSAVDLAAESVLLYTLSRLEPPDEIHTGLVARITEITDERFADPTLSITTLAEELSYHPKYISHVFKEKTGTAYSEYLRLVRLRYATALFNHGIDSVKSVALLSGFSDPLYFSTVFKKQLGISPREYIERTKLSQK